jgi:hypothetical protein
VLVEHAVSKVYDGDVILTYAYLQVRATPSWCVLRMMFRRLLCGGVAGCWLSTCEQGLMTGTSSSPTLTHRCAGGVLCGGGGAANVRVGGGVVCGMG